jgi:phosphoribosylamine--glycine ligase
VPGAYVLQAGTAAGPDGVLRSAGGRVLDIVGTGGNIEAARVAAYEAAARIQLRGGWWRGDIAAAAARPVVPAGADAQVSSGTQRGNGIGS